MKKAFTLFIALFFAIGWASAQDVYFCGNGNDTGKIWKNNTLIHSISDSLPVYPLALQVTADGTIYCAGNIQDSVYSQGHIWLNDSIVFSAGDNSVINSLIVNGEDWTAGGYNQNGWSLSQGVVWHNGEVLHAYSDSLMPNHIYAMCIDTVTGDIYSGGDTDSLGTATVWKNDMMFWEAELTSTACCLYHDGTNLYVGGYYYLEGLLMATLWENGEILYSFGDSLTSMFQAITIYDGDIYTSGYADDSVFVWKNGEVLYSHPFEEYGDLQALCVNEYGVYYAGHIDNIGIVWKDGEILYQPEGCNAITSLAVLPSETPQPGPEPKLLPWFDGFEADSTWTGWTILDFDGNTAIGWERSDDEAATDDYSARHLACDNIQEGWLISPPLYLRPYCDSTWMSFKTMEVNPSNYTNSSLLISTTGTQLSNFTEIWSQDNPSDTWDSIRIDLTEYQGDTIYLAFKYSGHHGHDWYIDDVNVEEALTLFDITVESSNPDWGTVTGGGSYPFGDSIQIEAIPSMGHEFLTWNDGIVSNPRDIVVTQDSTFIALFALSQYTIIVVSDHPDWGSVTGGGTFHYGDTIQITATSNLGFEFLHWDDGNADNPRDIIVTEDLTITAYFGIQQCIINTEVTPEGAGTVDGAGTYDYNSTIHLVAHNNTGYNFIMWDDGDLTNPRTVVVEGDSTFTAVFKPIQYEITTECDPVEGGTVNGAGIYDYGSTATLTATPNENYTFLCWSDGIASNPRNVIVTGNANYKALFHLNGIPQYTITVTANDPSLGNVTGSGTYPEGTTIEISAMPNEGAYFVGWDDGNTDNPRSITVTEDKEFKAIFKETETHTITVRSENPLFGTTYGGGTYPVNTVVRIGATPNQGFYFSGWQDGDMNNPRTITVTGDAEYIASFSQNPVLTYTVTVYCDENQGFILGTGTYIAGATASIAAIPADNYYFVKWSDGTTDNPKEIIVDHDIVLAAFFEFTSVEENGLANASIYPNPANDIIRLEGLEGRHDICIYNLLGRLVKATHFFDNDEISIADLPAGFYLIRIDSRHTLTFIKK